MLKNWEVTLPGLTGKRTRKAYIWLPDCYEEDDVRRYPVLYLFDGHNTFVDGEATYGKSWGLASYLTWTKKPLIVVGVECNTRGNGRLREYSPVSFSDEKYGNVRGQGRKYMQWLVEELKPYIDENYRTMAYPTDEMLDWANQMVDANPNKKVIVSTHGYFEGPLREDRGRYYPSAIGPPC